jgi:hypothetical protein
MSSFGVECRDRYAGISVARHRSSAPSPSCDRHQQTIDVGRHAAGRPLPHRAPHKPMTQVALRAGRSRMLIAVHGLRKASEAIEDPLNEVV